MNKQVVTDDSHNYCLASYVHVVIPAPKELPKFPIRAEWYPYCSANQRAHKDLLGALRS